MQDITFAYQHFLWLLLIIPVVIGGYLFFSKKSRPFFVVSAALPYQSAGGSSNAWKRHIPFVLKILALASMIVAFARPQSSLSWQNVETKGIDIILSLDVSGSMLAQDLKPNRLEAAKKIAIDFIRKRPNDRVGLVLFAGESFTQCPLTTDHNVLINLFKDVKNGMIEDGTAIGMGLATAVNRLKNSDAKSKVVILLTDGVNNAGSIPPLTAAEIAKNFGVRVYTIGVGTKGMAPYPVQTPFGNVVYQDVEVQIDEETLQKIATITGGAYFRATDNKSLEKIFEEIDKLEKSKIQVTEFSKKKEEFLPLAAMALLLLSISFITERTMLKSIT